MISLDLIRYLCVVWHILVFFLIKCMRIFRLRNCKLKIQVFSFCVVSYFWGFWRSLDHIFCFPSNPDWDMGHVQDSDRGADYGTRQQCWIRCWTSGHLTKPCPSLLCDLYHGLHPHQLPRGSGWTQRCYCVWSIALSAAVFSERFMYQD